MPWAKSVRLTEGRALVRHSFETKTFKPKNTGAWDDAYARFQKIPSSDRL